jgi:hypothetical protein
MTVTGASVLTPHPPEFERFLYASVGDDRNGYAVTMLSALARLGFDPWNETAELIPLGREVAAERLGILLSKFRDVPALEHDHKKVGRELSKLLPERLSTRGQTGAAWGMTSGTANRNSGPSGIIWTIGALVLIMLLILFASVSGSGK